MTRDFGTTMDNHGIAGTLKIQCKSKKIAIDVKPNRKSVNLSDLSGGEKSITLSFFIHSLWKHLSCPFRGLDEWDVGMDAKNRRLVEKILVNKSCEQDDFQYFFISPQESVFDDPQRLKKWGDLIQTLKLEKNA